MSGCIPVGLLRVFCFAAVGSAAVARAATTTPMVLDSLVVSADRDSGSVLSREDMDLFQLDSLPGLSGMVPGFSDVSSDTGGYGDILGMRGSANTLFFSSPAVGMMVDDVPMGEVSTYGSSMLHLERLEVLRGPQGAAFGRNGAAGMLEMTTPGMTREWQSALSAGYGSDDAFSTRLQSSGPLGNGFFQSFQIYQQERDGYIFNRTLDRYADDRMTRGGLANLYWKPDDSSEWRLRVFSERVDDGSQRLSLLDSDDPFSVGSDVAGGTLIDRMQVSLHWTKRGTWGTLKSITAWQDWQMDPGVTDLNLTAEPGFVSSIQQDQTMWTQELRWESPDDAGPWSWRSGLFFMDQENHGDTTRDFVAEVFPMYFLPFSERTIYQIDQWNAAAYGRVSYRVTPGLVLQAGTRLEYAGMEIDRTKTDLYAPPSTVADDSGDWYVSPEIGVTYQACDSARLYARSAVGIRPAGYSAFSRADMAEYDSETAWTQEAGVSMAWAERRLDVSFGGFWSIIDDYQVNRPDFASTDYFTVNAERVVSYGLEAEAKWRPVDGLLLQGSAGWTHAVFDRYGDPLLAGVDYDGNAVPFIPEYTAALGARYEFGGGFHLQTSVRLYGATWFNEREDERYRQGAYATWDAEAGYANKGFSIALYGRNLLDQDYYTFINPQIEAGAPGDPRGFGVRMRIAF